MRVTGPELGTPALTCQINRARATDKAHGLCGIVKEAASGPSLQKMLSLTHEAA